MQEDADARAAFGWILEMYAFSIASATRDGGPIIYDIHPEFAVQPPWVRPSTLKGLSIVCVYWVRISNSTIVLAIAVTACWKALQKNYESSRYYGMIPAKTGAVHCKLDLENCFEYPDFGS